MAPTATAVVPCAFAVMPFTNVQYKCTLPHTEVPLARGKMLCPFKNEVQGLFYYYYHYQGNVTPA